MFYVAIVGQGTASQPSYVRVTETLCRDSAALRYIEKEKVMLVQQTRPGMHNKSGTPRLGAHNKGICRDRDFSIATNFL